MTKTRCKSVEIVPVHLVKAEIVKIHEMSRTKDTRMSETEGEMTEADKESITGNNLHQVQVRDQAIIKANVIQDIRLLSRRKSNIVRKETGGTRKTESMKFTRLTIGHTVIITTDIEIFLHK